MKKILSMVCIFSLLFALTACGSQIDSADSADSTAKLVVSQTGSRMRGRRICLFRLQKKKR